MNEFRFSCSHYTDTDIGKSLHTLFDTYLGHMLMKFEQNGIQCEFYKKIELFGKKWLIILRKVDAILKDVSVT